MEQKGEKTRKQIKHARKRVIRYTTVQCNATRKRGNEKTKLGNLNPLPRHSIYIYFVIAYISFYFLVLYPRCRVFVQLWS